MEAMGDGGVHVLPSSLCSSSFPGVGKSASLYARICGRE